MAGPPVPLEVEAGEEALVDVEVALELEAAEDVLLDACPDELDDDDPLAVALEEVDPVPHAKPSKPNGITNWKRMKVLRTRSPITTTWSAQCATQMTRARHDSVAGDDLAPAHFIDEDRVNDAQRKGPPRTGRSRGREPGEATAVRCGLPG
ncbi:MAG: hypothetical protein AB2A00_13335 [Myxococcota bacterium]